MKPVRFHPEARAELLDALNYHEQQRLGLGRELRRDFESILEQIYENPHGYAVADVDNVRYASFRKFQSRLVFIDIDDFLWIVAVSHHRRHPRYWSGRLQSDG